MLLVAAALLLVTPGIVSDLSGLVILAGVALRQRAAGGARSAHR